MKYIQLILLFLTLSFSGIAPGEDEKAAIGNALDNFAKVTGGWWLNELCEILPEEVASEFEKNVALINLGLAQDLKNPSYLLHIQQSAKKVATTSPYSECGDTAKQIIIATFNMSASWSKAIREQQQEKYN